MNRRALILEAALSALVAAVLVLMSGWSLHKVLERQKRYALERLQKPAVILIERSCHLKDDLAIQQVVSALGQAPGIYFAGVIGEDGKIMAHSQPANVGQLYRRAGSPVSAHPLSEAGKRWGTLVISASEKSLGCAWRHEMERWSLGGILLWLAWMARGLSWRNILIERDLRICDLSTMAEDQKQKEVRETEKQSQARGFWTAWLQYALGYIPVGTIILDQRQRVVAINPTATRLLNPGGEAMASGAHWSEVPLLQSCGATLERSLHSPGVEVKADLLIDGTVLGFTTLKNSTGTWVTFFPSKPVVK